MVVAGELIDKELGQVGTGDLVAFGAEGQDADSTGGGIFGEDRRTGDDEVQVAGLHGRFHSSFVLG